MKVGDKVKVVNLDGNLYTNDMSLIGQCGFVEDSDEMDSTIWVQFDYGIDGDWFNESNLELI